MPRFRLRTLLILLASSGLFIIGVVHVADLLIVLLWPQLLGIEVTRVGRDVSVVIPESLLTWQECAFWFALKIAAVGLVIALIVLLRQKPAFYPKPQTPEP